MSSEKNFTQRSSARKERRKQERTEKKQAKKEAKSGQAKHKKALTGTHFIRMLSRELIQGGADARMYNYKDGSPFTEETARQAFKDAVTNLPTFGVQLFTRDNERVVEELGGLYGGIPGGNALVAVSHACYERLMTDIGASGYGFTYDKYNKPSLNRLYNNDPHEFHCGLPVRKLVDISTQGLNNGEWVVPESSHLAPFLKEAKARGLSMDAAYEEALTKFHESQGRTRQPPL